MKSIPAWDAAEPCTAKPETHPGNIQTAQYYAGGNFQPSCFQRNHYSLQQICNGRLFHDLLADLKRLNIIIPIRHIDNSGAILNYPEFKLNMVRPGIMTYGIYPSPENESKAKLAPVMSFKTSIVLLKRFSCRLWNRLQQHLCYCQANAHRNHSGRLRRRLRLYSFQSGRGFNPREKSAHCRTDFDGSVHD